MSTWLIVASSIRLLQVYHLYRTSLVKARRLSRHVKFHNDCSMRNKYKLSMHYLLIEVTQLLKKLFECHTIAKLAVR